MGGALPDPADCAVAEVVPPSNSPWTARYAAFVPGAHQPVRRSEDYIVIARRPGQPFRPVFTIPFPFDEPGLELQDDPDLTAPRRIGISRRGSSPKIGPARPVRISNYRRRGRLPMVDLSTGG